MATLWPQAAATSPALVLAAVGVHTLSLFLVTSAVALLVYEKLGWRFSATPGSTLMSYGLQGSSSQG
jgi:hypothetical protein